MPLSKTLDPDKIHVDNCYTSKGPGCVKDLVGWWKVKNMGQHHVFANLVLFLVEKHDVSM